LGRTVLAKDPTDTTLRYRKLDTHALDAGTTTRGA